MNKKHTIMAVMISTAVIIVTACSDSGSASWDTAETMMIAQLGSNTDPSMAELILKQPETQDMIDCIAYKLEGQGWSQSDHDEFMRLTGGTGDIGKLSKLKEDEILEKIGPILMASTCM